MVRPIRACALLLAAGMMLPPVGCSRSSNGTQAEKSTTDAADGRCPHDIKKDKCPFCTPALIESEGFCGEHGVAEALCVLCRPYLKAAFRKKGDWCEKHATPDSQCSTCHPELKERIQPGAGHNVPQGG